MAYLWIACNPTVRTMQADDILDAPADNQRRARYDFIAGTVLIRARATSPHPIIT